MASLLVTIVIAVTSVVLLCCALAMVAFLVYEMWTAIRAKLSCRKSEPIVLFDHDDKAVFEQAIKELLFEHSPTALELLKVYHRYGPLDATLDLDPIEWKKLGRLAIA